MARLHRTTIIGGVILVTIFYLLHARLQSPAGAGAYGRAGHGSITYAIESNPLQINKNTPVHSPLIGGNYDTVPFDEDPWNFLRDHEQYGQPRWNAASLSKNHPHNYRGPGGKTFATFFSSRNATLQNPYFLAAQQVVYRVLWHPETRSQHHPFTVFVAPFVPVDQREALAAAGAVIRELPLIAWPRKDIAGQPRWIDQFSKLHMWGATEFERIAFLDVDAFPLTNIDALLDDDELVPRQRCIPDLLPPADRKRKEEICDYVYAGCVVDNDMPLDDQELNGGVLIFSPNEAMHARLLREMASTGWDPKMAEQALLAYTYGFNGPFPPSKFGKFSPVRHLSPNRCCSILTFPPPGREWNGFLPNDEDEGQLRVIHEKLWSNKLMAGTPWTANEFPNAWDAMLQLYSSSQFPQMRAADNGW